MENHRLAVQAAMRGFDSMTQTTNDRIGWLAACPLSGATRQKRLV